MRTLISRSLALPVIIFGLSYSFTVFAAAELVNNGTFGNIDSPSSSGWTSVSSKLTLKQQTINYGNGETKDVWACSSSTSSDAALTQENGIITLKPKTRYRISFNAFRDTSTGATFPTAIAALAVKIKSGTADYAIKDVLLPAMTFGSFNPSVNKSTAFEFVTPTEISPSNQPNLGTTKLYFSFDGTKPNNSGSICLSRISLQEVTTRQTLGNLTVNTIGYPMLGKKVAILSLVMGRADISGYTWRVYYKGNRSPTYNWNVNTNYFAVKTDTQGLPIKGTNGKYTLDTNNDGSPKVVGAKATSGQSDYLPPNDGIISKATAKLDKDSGEYTYTLDFSDLGIPKSQAMSIPDGSTQPFQYQDSSGKNWYVLSGNTFTSGSTIDSNEYTIVVWDKYNSIVDKSPPFAINNAPFNGLKKDALYSFYHQRSGEAITPTYGIGAKAENVPLTHNAGHLTESATCFTGKDLHGNDWGNGGTGCAAIAADKSHDFSGGWYDAADHGKYVVNGGVALWTLQNLIERLQKKQPNNAALNAAFPANILGLPATYNEKKEQLDNLSELMAEARKEMAWMLKMQIPVDYIMNVPVGNQATKQQPDANNVFGQNSANTGVYQVKVAPYPIVTPIYQTVNMFGQLRKILTGQKVVIRKADQPFASDVAGDVAYAGGTLPRLRIKLALTPENVGGMVFHSLHDTTWTGIPLDPSTYSDTSKGYLDPKTNQVTPNKRVLMYPTTAATLNFAAVAAQCSRIWKSIDPAFADNCLIAAKSAWTAANNFVARGNILRYEYTNTKPAASTAADGSWSTADSGANSAILQYGFALNPMFNGGGAYGDLRVSDEFLWASKELKLADGGTYNLPANPTDDSCSSGLQCFNWIYGFDWQNTSPLGYLSSWANNPTSANPDINVITNAANTYANYAQGYNFSKIIFDPTNRNTHYDWGANGAVLNRSLIMLTAYEANIAKIADANRGYCKTYGTTGYQNPAWTVNVTSEKTFCDTAYKSLNASVNSMGYLLGRNAAGKSFISGYGANSMAHPHHRWFAKAADVNYPAIPAGFIAGGPNTRDLPALRANTPRYSFADMTEWLNAHPGLIESSNTEWQVGDLKDSAHKYLETEIIPKCTTGLGNADRRWTIPEANSSGPVSYTPQHCYDDDYRSFATNEIAVNWQAPLVWVSQVLSEVYQ